VERVENPPRTQSVDPLILGIFVKEPVPGQVKTRLCPPLDAEQAAQLYTVALRETVRRMQAGPWQVRLFYAGGEEWFARQFPDLPRSPQAAGDLGARMQLALDQLLACGGRAALIGSDSPDLPLEQVDAAFDALRYHAAVTIPAADGGYVLIGARETCPPLFDAIRWSSGEVLAATRARAAATGTDYAEIGGWEDLDDADSLRRLVQRSPTSATARQVREHLAGCLDLSPAITDNPRQP